MNDRSIVGKGIGAQWYGGHVGAEQPAAVLLDWLGMTVPTKRLFPVDAEHRQQ